MLTRSEKEHEEDEVDEAKENTEDKEEESERMLMIMSMISDNYDGVQTVQWKTECPTPTCGVLVLTSGITSMFSLW